KAPVSSLNHNALLGAPWLSRKPSSSLKNGLDGMAANCDNLSTTLAIGRENHAGTAEGTPARPASACLARPVGPARPLLPSPRSDARFGLRPSVGRRQVRRAARAPTVTA